MKDTSMYLNGVVRNAIAKHIADHMDRKALAVAEGERDKDERYSSIERIIRKSVSSSPIVIFNGIQHVFDGVKYSPFTWADFYDALRRVLDDMNVKGCNHRRMKDYVNSCIMAVNDRVYSVDSTVVVMGNGVYDTSDGELHPFNEKYMTNVSVSYRYNDRDMPILWRSFLDQVLPDRDHQELLREFIASCYADREKVKLEHMLILKGRGSNGKSVIFETIMELFGKDNVSTFSIADLIGSRREQNIAAVLGKRINYCSEIKTTEIGRQNADAFKSLVSGEPTMARQLYHEPFKAVGIPLIMANANTLPALGETSDSITRRILIIPFNTCIQYKDQNKELAAELRFELPAIFNWVMQGYENLKKRKFVLPVPNSIRSIVEDYACDNSVILRWLEDKKMFKDHHKYTRAVADWYKTKDLYEDFVNWCDGSKEMVKNRTIFSNELADFGFTRSRRSGGDGFYIYRSLTSDDMIEANMDLAIARERKYGVDIIREELDNCENPKTKDIEKLEKYLGLESDTIWYYLANGHLDLTYRSTPEGPEFDIRAVQRALARAGYYNDLKSNSSSLKDKSVQSKRVYARKFNDRMKMIGEPFRIYDNNVGMVPFSDKNCILVPFGWEYSAENARKMIEMVKFNSDKNFINNGSESEEDR